MLLNVVLDYNLEALKNTSTYVSKQSMRHITRLPNCLEVGASIRDYFSNNEALENCFKYVFEVLERVYCFIKVIFVNRSNYLLFCSR